VWGDFRVWGDCLKLFVIRCRTSKTRYAPKSSGPPKRCQSFYLQAYQKIYGRSYSEASKSRRHVVTEIGLDRTENAPPSRSNTLRSMEEVGTPHEVIRTRQPAKLASSFNRSSECVHWRSAFVRGRVARPFRFASGGLSLATIAPCPRKSGRRQSEQVIHARD
jgi:hypothetical protein